MSEVGVHPVDRLQIDVHRNGGTWVVVTCRRCGTVEDALGVNELTLRRRAVQALNAQECVPIVPDS